MSKLIFYFMVVPTVLIMEFPKEIAQQFTEPSGHITGVVRWVLSVWL